MIPASAMVAVPSLRSAADPLGRRHHSTSGVPAHGKPLRLTAWMTHGGMLVDAAIVSARGPALLRRMLDARARFLVPTRSACSMKPARPFARDTPAHKNWKNTPCGQGLGVRPRLAVAQQGREPMDVGPTTGSNARLDAVGAGRPRQGGDAGRSGPLMEPMPSYRRCDTLGRFLRGEAG